RDQVVTLRPPKPKFTSAKTQPADEDDLEDLKPPVLFKRQKPSAKEAAEEIELSYGEDEHANDGAYVDDDDAPPSEEATIPPADEQVVAQVRRDIVVKLPSMLKPRQTAPPPQPPKELGEYHLPGWDCLDDAEYGYTESQEQFVRDKAAVLEKALKEFDIEAH